MDKTKIDLLGRLLEPIADKLCKKYPRIKKPLWMLILDVPIILILNLLLSAEILYPIFEFILGIYIIFWILLLINILISIAQLTEMSQNVIDSEVPVRESKAEQALRLAKMNEIASYWPYGEKEIYAVSEEDTKSAGFELHIVSIKYKSGAYRLFVDDAEYEIFVKESGLIAKSENNFYRLDKFEMKLDKKYFLCVEGSEFYEVAKSVEMVFSKPSLTTIDSSINITDKDILELVEREIFSFNGHRISKDGSNIAKEYIDHYFKMKKMVSESCSDNQDFQESRMLFEYYLENGINAYSQNAIVNNATLVDFYIAKDKAAISQYALVHDYGDYNLPETSPTHWMAGWGSVEIIFNYLSCLLKKGSLELFPVSYVKQDNSSAVIRFDVKFEDAFMRQALKMCRFKIPTSNKLAENDKSILESYSRLKPVFIVSLDTEKEVVKGISINGKTYLNLGAVNIE